MFETVVYDYQVGHITDRHERGGVQYVSICIRGKNTVTPARDVVTLEKFMDFARRAELEACDWCNGNGTIHPIENPPFTCEHCSGRGYFVARE